MIPPAPALGGLIGAFLGWAGGQLGAAECIRRVGRPLIAWIPGAITSFLLAQWPAMLSRLARYLCLLGRAAARTACHAWRIDHRLGGHTSGAAPCNSPWGCAVRRLDCSHDSCKWSRLLGLAGAIVVFIAQTAAGVDSRQDCGWGAAMLGWVAKKCCPSCQGC